MMSLRLRAWGLESRGWGKQVPSYGGFPKFGVPFLGSHNEDYSIVRSTLGFPYLGKLSYDDSTGW